MTTDAHALAASGKFPIYDIGTPGTAWGAAEKAQWLSRQTKKYDYFKDVLSRLLRVSDPQLEVFQYGTIDYRGAAGGVFGAEYPMFGIRSKAWDAKKKLITVTGGTHGYETSGYGGALLFVEKHMARYAGKFNVLVLPCQSPWAMEAEHRWNARAVDPNRQYNPATPNPECPEATLCMTCIAEHAAKSDAHLAHFDLHDTTDTDNTLFCPTKHARDGITDAEWSAIPQGFYAVMSSDDGKPDDKTAAFAKACNAGVVATGYPLAPADENGCIIGEKVTDVGVVFINGRQWGINGAHTHARYAITTECYPDMAPYSAELYSEGWAKCCEAQVGCIVSGIDHALKAEGIAE